MLLFTLKSEVIAAGTMNKDLSGIRNATDSWTSLAQRIPADLQGRLPALQTELHDHQVQGLSWMVRHDHLALLRMVPATEHAMRKLWCRWACTTSLSTASWQMRWVCSFVIHPADGQIALSIVCSTCCAYKAPAAPWYCGSAQGPLEDTSVALQAWVRQYR